MTRTQQVKEKVEGLKQDFLGEWARLTGEEIPRALGDLDGLIRRLRRKLGHTEVQVEDELERLFNDLAAKLEKRRRRRRALGK